MSTVISASELCSCFYSAGLTPRHLVAQALKFNPVVEGAGPLMWPHIAELKVEDILGATVDHPQGVMPAIKAIAWEITPLLVGAGGAALAPTRQQIEQLLVAVELMLEPHAGAMAVDLLMNTRHENGFFRREGALKPSWVAESLEPSAQRCSWVEKEYLGDGTLLHIWGYVACDTGRHKVEHISGYFSHNNRAAGYFEASVLGGDWTDFKALTPLVEQENDVRRIVLAWARLLSYSHALAPMPLPDKDANILVLHSAELLPELCGKNFLQKAIHALWQARQPERWDLALVQTLPAQYPEDFSMLPAEIRSQAYEDQERLLQHAQTLLSGLVPVERILGCSLERTTASAS